MVRKSSVFLFAALIAPAFACAGEWEGLAASAEGALRAAFVSARAQAPGQDEPAPPSRQEFLDEHLRSAAGSGSLDEISRLVKMGADPNAYNGRDFTPLALAAMHADDPAAAELLISLGADVNFKGVCDVTALHEAASRGNLEIAKLLLAHGARLDAKACLGETPLVEAAKESKTEMFKYLLGLGADPNATDWKGNTPFILAAGDLLQPKDNEILNALAADKRVNVNAENKEGVSALKAAVAGGGVDMVKFLLGRPGLNVNANGGGTTALFLAELNHNEEIAQLLRAAGALENPGSL